MNNTATIYRSDYQRRSDYLADYHLLSRSYDFKARIYDGWMFFAFVTDYLTWRNQR